MHGKPHTSCPSLLLPALPVPWGRAAHGSWGTWGMVTHSPVSPGRGGTLQGARGLLVWGGGALALEDMAGWGEGEGM